MQYELSRITVHYETFGEGRPALMLHGMPMDYTQMVREMEPYFLGRDGWKRIYLDMPGHGQSPNADWITSMDDVLRIVEEFLDRIIPGQRFMVAGTSYGGYIGRGLVHDRGAQMDGLLLNVPAISPDKTKLTLPPRTVLVQDEGVLKEAKSSGVEWFEEGAVVQDRANLEYAKDLNKAVADYAFLDKLRKHGFSFDVDKLPEPFRAPTLIITGRQDHWVGYRDAWNIIENYPRATFVVLDRAGHLVLGEQPIICSSLIREWLDRVEEWGARHTERA